MNQTAALWMPAILALFGSLIVVVITAWLNTKTLSAQIETVRAEMGTLRAEMRGEIGTLRGEMETLRAEMKQYIAEAELRITTEILEVKARVDRLEEQRGLIRQP